MVIMDRKGGSWVGDFYQRLEAMCVEVEEVICEDTLKYVENQVRNVGDTVKKFYTEVLEDLRSPSSLDEDNHSNDDVKTWKKENADDETEPDDDSVSEKVVRTRNGVAAFKGNKSHRCCSAAIYRVIKPCEPLTITCPAEEGYDKVNSRSNNTESSSLYKVTTDVEEDLDCREDSQNKFLSNDTEPTSLHQITSVEGELGCSEDSQNNSISNSESMYSTVSDNSEEMPNNGSEESASALEDASVKEAFEVSHTENGVGISGEMVKGYECGGAAKEHKTNMLSSEHFSTDFNLAVSPTKANLCIRTTDNVNNSLADEELSVIDLETSSLSHSWESRRYDADKLGAFVGAPSDNINLEGSCVLVDNFDHSSKSALSQVQKSYKKRIQDAFSRRKWSKSKRDQEVLDALHEEQSANTVSCSATMQDGRQKLQISESFESDWELL